MSGKQSLVTSTPRNTEEGDRLDSLPQIIIYISGSRDTSGYILGRLIPSWLSHKTPAKCCHTTKPTLAFQADPVVTGLDVFSHLFCVPRTRSTLATRH